MRRNTQQQACHSDGFTEAPDMKELTNKDVMPHEKAFVKALEKKSRDKSVPDVERFKARVSYYHYLNFVDDLKAEEYRKHDLNEIVETEDGNTTVKDIIKTIESDVSERIDVQMKLISVIMFFENRLY